MGGRGSSVARPDDDFYPTPASAIVPLLAAEDLGRHVWEPACGDGAISRLLEQHGIDVVSANLTDRGYGETGVDFLAELRLRAPVIMTNPPSKLGVEFVVHALKLGADKVVMLLRTKFLEGGRRYRRIFGPTPPIRIHQFIDRVVFFAGDTPRAEQPGWSNEAFAWFVWQRDYKGAPAVHWIRAEPRVADDGRQGRLEGLD